MNGPKDCLQWLGDVSSVVRGCDDYQEGYSHCRMFCTRPVEHFHSWMGTLSTDKCIDMLQSQYFTVLGLGAKGVEFRRVGGDGQ